MFAEVVAFVTALLATVALVFWCVIAAGIVLYRRDHHTVRPAPTDADAVEPVRVSVIVPAHDEAADIEACVRSILAQTHRRLEVIVADDRSTDGTGAIVRHLAERDPRLRLLRIDHVPTGWTGKTHALSRAVEAARGEWLLFTDADTLHAPGSLAACLRHAAARGAVMLSGWPAPRGCTWVSRLVDPICGTLLASWYRRRGSRHGRRFAPFANGQFLLIRAAALAQVGGYHAVRGRLLEDIALAGLLDLHDLPFEVVLLHEVVTVRTYDTLSDSQRGWSRIFLHGAGGNVRRLLRRALVLPVIALAGWLALGVGLIGSATRMGPAAVASGVAAIAAMTMVTTLTYRQVRLPAAYAALAPAAALLTALFLAAAVRDAVTTRTIEWHGLRYPSRVR